MKDYVDGASSCLSQSTAPRPYGYKRLLIGGVALAFAFMLALSAGAILSLSTGTTQAEAHGGPPSGQQSTTTVRSHNQCNTMTVSSVNGSTIVLHSSCNKYITVHTTSSTQYEQAGRYVSASDIKVGTRVHVTGQHNSDGSITASRIVIN